MRKQEFFQYVRFFLKSINFELNSVVLSQLKSFFRDTVLYGLASITPRLVSFILVPIHTSTLDTAKYSLNTNYYVYAVFLNALLTLGMETAFFRFFSREEKSGNVFSTTYFLLLVTSCIFLALTYPSAAFLAEFMGFPDPLFIKLLACTIFFDTLVVIPFAWLRAKGKSLPFAGYKIINVLITLLLNVWLLLVLPESKTEISFLPQFFNSTPEVSDIFMANLMASVLTFVLCFPLLRNLKFQIDKALLKRMLSYSWPIMVAGIAYGINENLDKLFIAGILGDDVNGMYAGCYKLGVFMSLYVMTFRLGAEPFFFNHYGKEGAENLYSRIMTWFVILGALCLITVVAFIDFFASLLLKQESYKEALEIVPFILLANIFLGIYNNLSIWYKLKDKTLVGMTISVTGAILTVFLLWMLLPISGYMGAAYTTLFVYGFMALTSFLLGRSYYPVPYEIGKVVCYLGMATLLSFISFYYFRGIFWFNATMLVVFLTGIIWKEQDQLFELKRSKNPGN